MTVIRLDDLTNDQRRLVLALIEAGKSQQKGSPAMAAEPKRDSSQPLNWEFKSVALRTLKIDPRYHYEKRFNQRRADRIAREWDDRKCGVLTVSDRGESKILVDGVHRMHAARSIGIDFLPAKVFYGLDQQDEATVFSGLSDAVRLTPFALFKARLVAHDSQAVEIQALADKYRVHLGDGGSASNGLRTTRSVTTLEVLHSVGVLDDVLDVLTRALPDDPFALNTIPLQGVGSFILVYRGHPRYQRSRLIQKLAEASAVALIRDAKDLKNLPGKFGTGPATASSGAAYRSVTGQTGPRRAVLARYNHKLHEHLPDAGQRELKLVSMGRNPWTEVDAA